MLLVRIMCFVDKTKEIKKQCDLVSLFVIWGALRLSVFVTCLQGLIDENLCIHVKDFKW